jgi:hypothetical protein
MQENNQPREAFNPKEQFKRLQNLITTVLACLKNLSKKQRRNQYFYSSQGVCFC